MDYEKEFKAKCNPFGKRELKVLAAQINEGENVIDVVGGTLKLNGNDGMGIFVLTNHRIFFMDKSMFNIKIEEITFEKITNISYKKSIVYGDIILTTAGGAINIGSISKAFVQEWVDNAKKYIDKKVSVNSSVSSLDELEKLATLKEKGILTEKEFKEQKKKILG
jgi:Bacterial PH domain